MEEVIRDASEADIPQILAIYNHAAVHTTATADECPVLLEARLEWFRERRSLNLSVLVIEQNEEIIAWGALSPYSPKSGYRFSVENSVYVKEGNRGRGLGRRMLAELIERAKNLGCHVIVASIDGENLASIQLHQSFGFVQAGHYRELFFKFGRWLDVVHLQLTLE